jgi:hypothetical protein
VTKRRIEQFIRGLKKARNAVDMGDTGCQDPKGKDSCWRCAMKYHSGVHHVFSYGLVEPDGSHVKDDGYWSLDRPRTHTLAMFDNSIAALERHSGYSSKETP